MKLSLNQEDYFKNSAVRNMDGELLIAYHGSGTEIKSFDPSYTGKGMDQYGSGFYFTTDKSYADSYTTRKIKSHCGKEVEKLGGEDKPTVIQAYLNVTHPIYCNGECYPNLSHIEIPNHLVYDIVKKLPSLYHLASDEIEPNPLSDYSDEFWENEPQNISEFERLIKKMVKTYFQDTNLKVLDNLFEKYSTEFRQAVHDVMGYDGIIVNFKDCQHIIAWFPEQIKDVNNLNPQISVDLKDEMQMITPEHEKMDNKLQSLIDNAKKIVKEKGTDSQTTKKQLKKSNVEL